VFDYFSFSNLTKNLSYSMNAIVNFKICSMCFSSMIN
jgi:hypothetical protein